MWVILEEKVTGRPWHVNVDHVAAYAPETDGCGTTLAIPGMPEPLRVVNTVAQFRAALERAEMALVQSGRG